MIVIDKDQEKGTTSIDGMEYTGGGLNSGKCGLNIASTTQGVSSELWTCTLVTNDGQVLTGTTDYGMPPTLTPVFT